MVKYNFSKLNLFNGRLWKLYSLLASSITLLLWFSPLSADQLIDVRVGEYEGFTRIVFEVDGPSAVPRIEISSPGELSVAFDRTDVNLVRKIPVERSRHIKDIQFWQRGNNMSAVLKVDHPHFRFETFALSNPPRIAVDIFPMAAPADSATAAPTIVESSDQLERNNPSMEEDASLQARERDDAPADQAPPGPLVQPPAEADPGNSAEAADEPVMPKLRQPRPNEGSTSPQDSKTGRSPFRLQFFLVIGLVVITIGILFLLLLMLFARHRLSELKSKLSAGEFLLQQDKKIAALNSRIKEQFDRYDKA